MKREPKVKSNYRIYYDNKGLQIHLTFYRDKIPYTRSLLPLVFKGIPSLKEAKKIIKQAKKAFKKPILSTEFKKVEFECPVCKRTYNSKLKCTKCGKVNKVFVFLKD